MQNKNNAKSISVVFFVLIIFAITFFVVDNNISKEDNDLVITDSQFANEHENYSTRLGFGITYDYLDSLKNAKRYNRFQKSGSILWTGASTKTVSIKKIGNDRYLYEEANSIVGRDADCSGSLRCTFSKAQLNDLYDFMETTTSGRLDLTKHLKTEAYYLSLNFGISEPKYEHLAYGQVTSTEEENFLTKMTQQALNSYWDQYKDNSNICQGKGYFSEQDEAYNFSKTSFY